MRAMLTHLSDMYARATGMTIMPEDECIASTLDMVKTHGGVALGELHGDYAFAAFTRQIVKAAAGAGVRRLYVEMFQQRTQPILDRWQHGGDAEELIYFINNETTSYSPKMWVHYWNILRTARAAGIRVIGIEPSVIKCPYPGTEMYMRNDAWVKCIEADQARDPAPYLVYCGRNHLTRKGCNQGTPLHEMLGISGVFMRRGVHGMGRIPGQAALYNLWIPKAHDQTPIYGNGHVVANSIPLQRP